MDIWSIPHMGSSLHTKAFHLESLPCDSVLWTLTGNYFSFSVSVDPNPSSASFPTGDFVGPLLLTRVSFSGEWLLISMTYPPKDPWGFPGGSVGKESACSAGNHLQYRRYRFSPWVRISPGEEHGNPFQYSCLEDPIDRGAWWATVHGVTRVGHDLVTTTKPPRTPRMKISHAKQPVF